jgi:hypothetical protein
VNIAQKLESLGISSNGSDHDADIHKALDELAAYRRVSEQPDNEHSELCHAHEDPDAHCICDDWWEHYNEGRQDILGELRAVRKPPTRSDDRRSSDRFPPKPL